jgi:hypothetical protein
VRPPVEHALTGGYVQQVVRDGDGDIVHVPVLLRLGRRPGSGTHRRWAGIDELLRAQHLDDDTVAGLRARRAML